MFDNKYMICVRVDAVRPGEVVADVTKGECSDCQKEVWMAPSSTELIKREPDVKIICQPCGAKMLEASAGDPVFAMAPGALAELLRYNARFRNN
jgi:DNA-directed RNA polymerase subunit RPC12/RpoP